MEVTIPCAQEPSNFAYSFCLIYTDYDIGSDCAVICNPPALLGGCCYLYSITNPESSFGPLDYTYTDCCTGGEVVGAPINSNETVYVCSQTYPSQGPLYPGNPVIRKENCCDCFNEPGLNCQPYGTE
jgi:hypothetical protein